MDAILYTDGHGTKVTSSEFITRDSRFLIKGIVDARINKIRTSPFPALICMLFGLLLAALGLYHVLDSGTGAPRLSIGNISLTPNGISVVVGIIFFCIGILAFSLRQRRYSVHITTAEGERDPVISRKQDYIRLIVAALQNALMYRRDSGLAPVQPSP